VRELEQILGRPPDLVSPPPPVARMFESSSCPRTGAVVLLCPANATPLDQENKRPRGPAVVGKVEKSQPGIAVVVATRDRAPLLAGRALPSIMAQTRVPDHLVVVDDSSAESRAENRDIVASVNLRDARVNYLENEKTAGASGSWNTALEFLYRQVDDPVDLFVAILDDDDAWAPDYLERCVALACNQALDMVAADMQRIEAPDGAALSSEAPESLCAADLLIVNPGIQGSNLFVRLSVLLAAGGFDEALRSTTDRDLCIRISDLGTVRYGRLAVPLVRHFADSMGPRLSTRGSEAKFAGLTAFWQKYAGRMTATQRLAFCDRAWALFDWRPGSGSASPSLVYSPAATPNALGPGERSTGDLQRSVGHDRIAAAERRVKRSFAIESLRLLGRGSEAVVFTDGRTVYKCIDSWQTRMPRSQLDFLRGQIGRWQDVPGLYALREVAVDGPWAVLTYDYEPSVPYCGGHDDDLIGLLEGCRQVGVVCNNVHPKNLVVTASGVKLIDYGSDIRTWTVLGFEHMALRAFLACRHTDKAELPSLMRRALTEPDLPELAGFDHFRERLRLAGGARPDGQPGPGDRIEAEDAPGTTHDAPPHGRFALYVGVITSDPAMLRPLLADLAALRSVSCIARLVALVLENGGPAQELRRAVHEFRCAGLEVALVSEQQQRQDAATGAFGGPYRGRPPGQVGIAQARTMLQRYLGALMRTDDTSFAWILDDDMRVDGRARTYLPWLPAFRERGVHALIGQYEGSSPNPPINGMRVALVDLLHNLAWLQTLDPTVPLPDRSAENRALRAKYPDYYYDLSRKHTGHLEMPHWIELAFEGETVDRAHARLRAGAVGILSGAPLTRPLVAYMPQAPLAAAEDSVNRGGCTFVLDPRALTQTPNITVRLGDREARRSDMMWAIINRYSRGLTIQRVGFPILHLGRVTPTPELNIEKVTEELVGAGFYAALTDFLRDEPHHKLDFSRADCARVCSLVEEHLTRRLLALELGFHRIRGLNASLRRLCKDGAMEELTGYLDIWFTPQVFTAIATETHSPGPRAFTEFLSSLRHTADEYASATVDIAFIQDQLRSQPTHGENLP